MLGGALQRRRTRAQDTSDDDRADLFPSQTTWHDGSKKERARTIAAGTAMAAFEASSLMCTLASNEPTERSHRSDNLQT